MDFTRKGRKGAEFWNSFLPLLSSYERMKNLEFSQILTLQWYKNWSYFDQTRDKKSFLHFFLSGRIFWPVRPDYLGKSWQHWINILTRKGTLTTGITNNAPYVHFTNCKKHATSHTKKGFQFVRLGHSVTILASRSPLVTRQDH
jgi:hypothetical protein